MLKRSQSLAIDRENASILRFLIAIFVILTHTGFIPHSVLPTWMRSYVSSATMGGMALFLIISGYGLMVSTHKNGLDGYWDKKINRVFAPAWITQILFYGLTIVLSFLLTGDITTNWHTLFGDILCVHPDNAIDGTMWFISYLLLCYVSFYLFFLIIPNKNFATLFLSGFWLVSIPIQIMMWRESFYCAGAFIVGVWIGYFTVEKPVRVSVLFKFAAMVLCFGYIVYYRTYGGNRLFLNIYSIAIALFLILAVQYLPRRVVRTLAPFCGKYAFPLFLLEYKIIYSWFPYINYSPRASAFILILLTACCFAVSMIYQKILDFVFARPRKQPV